MNLGIQIKIAGLQAEADKIKFRQGTGCNRCRMTGFKGLTGIYELVIVDDVMSEMIINNASDVKFRNYASSKSYRPLFQEGLDKVRSGEVNLEELLRVISIVEREAVVGTERETAINV
ncbi:MAG: hypothetical protein CVT49_11435 [candidate division Zixibacteria bacterium HGW-Zixibacteria-1]|nr:MAG: hypothetical protein CVT49_11435 [candidate division Zixibacteria bacterium HGW-Zixibacteria-1]